MMRSHTKHRRALAALASLAFLATACGGGDDGDANEPTPSTGDDTETTEPVGEPQHGGTLIYAVEADTSNPWTPSGMACTGACYSTVGRTVYEPLMMAGTDGNYYPYLLESIEPNEDFTVWTLVVRDGISFHDGTPLDGPAVSFNLERTRNAALTGPAVRPMDTITDDGDRTVTVTMSESWPGFNFYLTSQLGLMASPTWLAAVEAGTASATAPVGTGPFVYVSYESGENGNFRAERNPDYWRGDGPSSVTGEGLPYVDAIDVRFIPDSQARSQALLAGDIDMLHVANGVELVELQETDGIEVQLMDDPGATETGYLLLNQQETLPDGSPNPFHDIRVRRALAHATNSEVLSQTRGGGIYPPANGPFPPGRIGYLEDTGFPEYDPAAAEELLAEVEADGGSVAIALKTTTDPFNLTTAEVLKEMYEEVGFEVAIDQIPQGEFVSEALAGNFQVFTWRNHAGIEPDAQFIWWHSSTTQGIAINFGRIIDDEVDRLLGIARSSTDPDERRQAAEDLNRYFADQVFNVWFQWQYWGHAHGDHVENVGNVTIPDAPEDVTALLGSTINPTEIFEEG